MSQEKLRRLIKKRHPEYAESVTHWSFLNACYKGGRDWFKNNIFKYLKEGDDEYKDRVDRAYRFNHSKEVVDLVDKYLFKAPIFRNTTDASEEVKAFWLSATKGGLNIEQYAKQLSRKSSIFGSIWVVVDSSRVDDETILSIADEKKQKRRIYSYTASPERVLDFSYDENGEFDWVLIEEQFRDSADPLESTGEMIDRFRLWTKHEWLLMEIQKNKSDLSNSVNSDDFTVSIIDQGFHDLGLVPVFRVDAYICDELWRAPSLIGDIAYLDRAVANYLSNIDAIIQDQTFSQLVMPAQGLMPGEDAYTEMLKVGTKRIFLFDGERGGEPKFISPDPKQASVILGVIGKIINEIYHTVGMAGERTKQDNAAGIDNSSGVAKAFDFERINALLVSKAASLELAEAKLVRLVNLWAGKNAADNTVVEYSKSFDVRGLADEMQIAAQLSLIDAPEEMRREHMRALSAKLFPMLEDKKRKEIDSGIKKWPAAEETDLPGSAPERPDASKTNSDKKKETATQL